MTGAQLAAAPRAPLTYDGVNAAIAGVFFDGRFRLSPLYLDLEGQVLTEIAAQLGVDEGQCPELIAAVVSKSLSWNKGNPFARHLEDLEAWNELGAFDVPPFTALLAALSLAAERMHADGIYSAHNYYERLFELLGVQVETRKNSLKHNAAAMRVLWEALNSWLARNDYDFGRPTARPVNDWKYVSYALSQALVREADRTRLRALFPQFGLAPHERVSESEMSVYLHEWMRGYGPSNWLKKIWAVPDLRPRVAAAACSELEAWEGIDPDAADGRQRRRLSWAAAFHSFPRKEFRMFLAAAAGEEDAQDTLTLSVGASEAARAAFKACERGVWLTPSAGDIAVLEPTLAIALSPLMLASFELLSEGGSLSLSRTARPVIPLARLETGGLYREVSRISFLRPHLVLCHQEWRARVSKVLELNARPGFQAWEPSELSGVPDDWTLFTNVEMLRAPASAPTDMQVLVPLAEGAALDFNGGLRMAHNLWHAAAPPEITAIAPIGPVGIRVTNARGEVLQNVEWKTAACRLSLAPAALPDPGDFNAAVTQGGKVRREITLSIRSSANPRPLPAGEAPQYQVDPGAAEGLLSARPRFGGAAGLLVRGMAWSGQPGPAARGGLQAAADLTGQGEEETDAEEDAEYRRERFAGLKETCVLRGYHHWDCEEFRNGDQRSDDKWMTCKDCSNAVLTRNRGAVKRTGAGPRPGKATAPPGPIKMNPRQTEQQDPNLVLDALCWLGTGPWSRLGELAASQNAAPWEAARLANALRDLGHIDVVLDPQLRQPVSWAVAPAALVFTSTGQAFLAGFRNPQLLADISSRLAGAGGAPETIPQDEGPDVLLWSGLDPDRATRALDGLSDHHRRPVAVVHAVTGAIARSAPALSAVFRLMPEVHLEAPQDLRWFDPGAARWTPASGFGQPGAYRASLAGRRYVFRDRKGETREGPYQVVKLLAAKAAGLRLHGYDASRRAFQALLGCEPPGLLSRALTASSGRLPQRAAGRIIYSNVSPEDAACVLERLYS